MKKLIVMAAVACAALGLRAATANWNVSIAEYAADWSSPVGSVVISMGGTDYTATFNEYGTAETVISDVPSDTPFDVTMSVVLDDGNTYTRTISGYTTPTFAGTPADQTALTELNGNIAIAFTDPNTGALPDAASAPAQGWVAAPEPTSGLLLLLGMAGLALRRRRA